MRWRHEVAERWIAEGRAVDDALGALEELTFDPELDRRYEAQIAATFREQLG
jgi:hypothetical protein